METHKPSDRFRLEWAVSPFQTDQVLLVDRTNNRVVGGCPDPEGVRLFIDFANDPRDWSQWPIFGNIGPVDNYGTTLAVTDGDRLKITKEGNRDDAFYDRLAFLGIGYPHSFAFETEDTRARWRDINTPDVRAWLRVADEIFADITDPLKSGRRSRAIDALTERLGKVYQHENTRAIAARLLTGAEWREYQRNAQQ